MESENSEVLKTSNNENEANKNIRKEKMITRRGIIITCILLFFVSIFLDLYFIYISKITFVMKVILCIIHPLLFVIFSFIPSGLYLEFNYDENKFIYHKTSIVPWVWNKCTRNEINIDNIQEFSIDTGTFLWFRSFNLYYTYKSGKKIKIISGRDKNCRSQFSKEVLNIPDKLNSWLKNEDFVENEPFSKDDPNENEEKNRN